MNNMKTYPGSVILCLTFVLSAFLIPAHAQRFRGSINGGINLSQVDGDRLAGFNQPGLTGGIQVNTIFTTRWEASMELQFAQHGARRNINDDPAAPYERIRFNRVEIPVMIQFNEWKFQIGTGLSYSRLINYKVIDVFGTDVSEQLQFRQNGLAAVLGGTVFLRENTGINLIWQKSIWNLYPQQAAQPRWIGRSVSIRGVFRI